MTVAVVVAALDVAVPLLVALELTVELAPGQVNAEVDAVRAEGVRYQLASGSPRHSPIVTPL
jgi:hypothetical protein